jgi:hypothetical protein
VKVNDFINRIEVVDLVMMYHRLLKECLLIVEGGIVLVIWVTGLTNLGSTK